VEIKKKTITCYTAMELNSKIGGGGTARICWKQKEKNARL
jgi:hypothetical protein